MKLVEIPSLYDRNLLVYMCVCVCLCQGRLLYNVVITGWSTLFFSSSDSSLPISFSYSFL